MNHFMEDLSFIKFKRLRKNKSEEDQKILHKKTLLDKKQSVETCPVEAGSSRQSYLEHSSLPSLKPHPAGTQSSLGSLVQPVMGVYFFTCFLDTLHTSFGHFEQSVVVV